MNWSMNAVDTGVLFVYLFGITAFGIWAGYRRHASTEQYFLASKSLGWFTVGAAVFTSNISTIHLVGLAAGGAKEGMVIGNFEWMACFTLMLLALVFAPFYITSKVSTLPEFMERRYCPQARTFLAFIGLLGALLIHIGISLFAAAKVFESFLGVPMLATIVVLSLFTVTYTALGGLKAVVMTENVQVILLLSGATLITALGILALPSVGMHDVSAFRAAVAPGQLSMLQPIREPGGTSERVLLAGGAAGLSDPRHLVLVRGPDARAAGARREGPEVGPERRAVRRLPQDHAGVPDGPARRRRLRCSGDEGRFRWPACRARMPPDYNTMLPALINLPRSHRAARACWRRHGGGVDELHGGGAQQLRDAHLDGHREAAAPGHSGRRAWCAIGRITTGVIMLLAMLWSTQGDQFGTIFEAINKIPMTFAPAVTTVFVLGILWKRGTWQGAMTTLYAGSILGIVYFVLDLPGIGRLVLESPPPAAFSGLITDPAYGIGIPFMLAGPLLAVVCVIIYVVASLATPAMSADRLEGVCWDHPLAFLRGPLTGASDPRAVTMALFATVAVLYGFLH